LTFGGFGESSKLTLAVMLSDTGEYVCLGAGRRGADDRNGKPKMSQGIGKRMKTLETGSGKKNARRALLAVAAFFLFLLSFVFWAAFTHP